MNIDETDRYAQELCKLLNSSSTVSNIVLKKTAGCFIDHYHDPLPDGSGVYLISTLEEIIYIGKAGHFKRIWRHVGIPNETKEFIKSRLLIDVTLG